MSRQAKPRTIQHHHVIYNAPDHPGQEWVVPIFAGEHELVGKMWLYSRKTVSKGFIQCLKYFIIRNEQQAVDLENITKEKK